MQAAATAGKVALCWSVLAEGLLFIVLSLTNVREAIFNAIPLTLKKGVSVGIQSVVAFIGLQNSRSVRRLRYAGRHHQLPGEFPHRRHTCALLTLIGLFLHRSIFTPAKMKGAILYGILLTRSSACSAR